MINDAEASSLRPLDPGTIVEVISAEGGRVSFGRFMDLALTHPTLGYYSRVDQLLWHGGDFSTAPAISPFFNEAVARLMTELVDASFASGAGENPVVVELGGGEGQLAACILRYWQSERPELRHSLGYRIVEIGGRLRERQAGAVADMVAAGWNVGWGADLEEAVAGATPVVILANEFLDALPVQLVGVSGNMLRQAYVKCTPSGIGLEWGDLDQELSDEIQLLFGPVEPERLNQFTEDGVLEIFPGYRGLLRQVARVMPAGTFVNIDYGEWFPGIGVACQQWGLEGRSPRRRTIRGYFKHQLARDPLARVGRQDLTSDVDFAAVDFHGRMEGFETVLYTTLAAFLRAGGAEADLAELQSADPETDKLEADRQATVLRGLLDEYDLGGAFKLMIQVRE
jgi:SAM-dependent MidA family methyltransferase